jgi:hypothetical protein
MNQLQVCFQVSGRLRSQQLFERSDNQSQRSTKVVTDIGEETHLRLIHFMLLRYLHLMLLLFHQAFVLSLGIP